MKKYYSKKYIYLLLLLLLVTSPGIAQQKVFTGTINDKDGNPVPNALVTIREQPGIKVFSDDAGKFTVTAETGQLLEIKTRDNRYSSLRVQSDPIAVTIGEGDDLIPIGNRMELRRDEVTSAIGYVKADELTKSSVRNPANALFGKIPGLTVLQNGGTSWNNDPDLFIRGVETFGIGTFVNTNILMIVDGFERPISSLSLAEIESVAVLKDAAALAMYGMRGANGVLLVTTKRGTGKNLSVDVNYERGVTTPFRLPKFLNASGYANAVNQARINDGNTALYSQPELDRFQSGSSPYLYPDVNWMDQNLKQYGSTDKISISFQQQANSVRYYAMINYDNEQGLLKPALTGLGSNTQISAHKFNFRTNVEIDLSRTLKFSVNVAGNLGESNRPATASNENDIIAAIYNTPSAAFPVRTYSGKWGGTSTYGANNPVALSSAIGYTVRGKREVMTDFILEQNLDKLVKGLTIEGGLSFDKSFDYQDAHTMTYQYMQITPVLDPTTFAVLDTTETLFGTNTSYAFATSLPIQWRRTTIMADLKYSKDWADNQLKAVLLFQREELIRTAQFNTYRHMLGAANVHYAKAGKYFADISLAYNGTNVLPKANRMGFFPAVSLGWKLSNESFLSGSKAINDLKLRASWGMTGNDQVLQNIDVSPYISATGYYFQSTNSSFGGYREGRLASAPLSYETSTKSNIGIDATVFGMLDLNIDAFYNKRKGILVPTSGSVSGVIGVLSPYSAAGIVTNKGIEAGFNFHKEKGDLQYHLSGQMSSSHNKIVEMLEIYRPNDYLKRTGRSVGQAFGLQAVGFFADAADIANSPKQTFSIVKPGDIKYKDQNSDNIINAFDEVPIGNSTTAPELNYAGSLGIEYKGIGFDVVFQGTANQTVYLNTTSIYWPLRANSSITTYSDGAWTPATASTATLPRLSMLESANNYRPNSVWLADAAYLKLRSVEVYYNLPKQVISKMKLAEIRIYVRGMNLASFDKIKNLDPEAIGATYPTMSSYNLGIQIGF